MKKSQKLAALMVLFGMLALVVGPVGAGPVLPEGDDIPTQTGNLI